MGLLTKDKDRFSRTALFSPTSTNITAGGVLTEVTILNLTLQSLGRCQLHYDIMYHHLYLLTCDELHILGADIGMQGLVPDTGDGLTESDVTETILVQG